MGDVSPHIRLASGGRAMADARGNYSPRSGLATSLTLAAMSLGYGVAQLDVTIVNAALDSIGASLGGAVSPSSSGL